MYMWEDQLIKQEMVGLKYFANQVVSDKLRIRQIMKYLVLNAIKFTQKGGVWIHLGVEGLDASSGQTSSKETETNNLGDESQSILSGMLYAVDGQESFEPEQRNDVSNPGMGKGKDSPKGADSEKSSNLSVQTLLWCEIKDTGVGIPQEVWNSGPTLLPPF